MCYIYISLSLSIFCLFYSVCTNRYGTRNKLKSRKQNVRILSILNWFNTENLFGFICLCFKGNVLSITYHRVCERSKKYGGNLNQPYSFCLRFEWDWHYRGFRYKDMLLKLIIIHIPKSLISILFRKISLKNISLIF